MEFEWDHSKALANLEKHGISFEEASDVFSDWMSSTVVDPEHSTGESRLLIFGRTKSGKSVVVSFTERGDILRIISARRMSRRETNAYELGPYE